MTYQVPNFDEQALAKIAKEHYGLEGENSSLVSYEDQNALIKTPKGKFVIKIANKRWDLEFIKMQTDVFEHLKNEFQERNVKKEYLALVYGVLETETGIIDFPLKRSKLTGRMVALPKHETGKKSITKYVVENKYSRYTYLKVTIETGRTHQIRSHLKAFNHPVVGDKIYYNKNLVNNLKLDRLFLHAHTLGFNDLNNEYKEYKIEIPKELNNILNELK